MTTLGGGLVPQVIVTLSPQGGLRLELPGANGHRQVIDVKGREVEGTLLRILAAQASRHCAIGEDGQPTQAQVEHWEKHGVFADKRCAFCRAEASPQPKAKAVAKVLREHSGVVVRTVPAKAKLATATSQSAEEIGL